jgi:hypothetical protein
MDRCLRRLAIAVCVLTLSGTSAWAQPATKNSGVVSSLDRFSGRLTVRDKRVGNQTLAAKQLPARSLSLNYQVLSLGPGTKAGASQPAGANLLALPLRAQGGFVIYELRAGKLTTVIDGKRQERREGEFWLVRPGESIALETEDDSVVVQTIQLPNP